MDSDRATGRKLRSFAEATSKGLTFERAATTLPTPHEPNVDEADNLMVEHFLRTLAEISLAIASRKVSP